ncbi:unnamed protein product, partial [Vitis vinifera]|uniref:Uncharacterized protein n=1 Tax=Vitis vinifera TaxID=29760 RepID=D7SK72_VITVI
MVREKVIVSTRTLQWKCVESRVNNKRLCYGRFILSPFIIGQADTIGIVMRRTLFGEIEGTCITREARSTINLAYAFIYYLFIFFKRELRANRTPFRNINTLVAKDYKLTY